MKKQKTRRDWLMELPEPINIMAVENCKKENKRRLNEIYCKNTSNALLLAFTWACTEEGEDFWNGVYLELRRLRK